MSLISFLTRTHFADRVLEDALPVELARLSLARVLVVCDAAGRGHEAEARLSGLLRGECDARYLLCGDHAVPEAGLAAEEEIDAVIGFGGRSALCLAHMVADARRRQGERTALLTIPTTVAGVGLFAPGQVGDLPLGPRSGVPDVIFCDPTLTLWADDAQTAAAAAEALSGCVESFLSAAWNPPADGIALDGIARIVAHLPQALADRQGLAPRRELLAAALNAGLAAQKGRGAAAALVDSLAHLPGGAVSPGRLHAAVLSAVLRFNAPASGGRFAPLASVLGLPEGQSVDAGVSRFFAEHGLGTPISWPALAPGQLEPLARRAAAHRATGSNPRLVTDGAYLALLEEIIRPVGGS